MAPRRVRASPEPRSVTRVERSRSARTVDGWLLTLVVPEQEVLRFGDVTVLDLLDLAAEFAELARSDFAAREPQHGHSQIPGIAGCPAELLEPVRPQQECSS